MKLFLICLGFSMCAFSVSAKPSRGPAGAGCGQLFKECVVNVHEHKDGAEKSCAGALNSCQSWLSAGQRETFERLKKPCEDNKRTVEETNFCKLALIQYLLFTSN